MEHLCAKLRATFAPKKKKKEGGQGAGAAGQQQVGGGLSVPGNVHCYAFARHRVVGEVCQCLTLVSHLWRVAQEEEGAGGAAAAADEGAALDAFSCDAAEADAAAEAGLEDLLLGEELVPPQCTHCFHCPSCGHRRAPQMFLCAAPCPCSSC